MKLCNKCLISKPLASFNKRIGTSDGRQYSCKDCNKQYYLVNAEKEREYTRTYYASNKEEIRHARLANSESLREYARQYYLRNKRTLISKKVARDAVRILVDVEFKLKKRLRGRMYYALKKGFKSGSTVNDLGCSVAELKRHIESQFQLGMTWENHGQWHIDHIKPLSKFNLHKRVEFLKACHYTNLRPLWAMDNWKKSNRIEEL